MRKFCSTFVPDSASPKGWVGQDIMDFVLQNATVCKFVSAKCFIEKQEKDVFWTLSSSHQTSQLWIHQKISQRSVHAKVYYTYMRMCVREDTAHMSLYNTRLAWAGWVAYLDGKAMRRPDDWDKQESFSHVFFCIHNRSINFYAKAGEW